MFDELYDFKLVNKDENKENGPYPICALIKMDNNINFFASEYNFGDNITRSDDKNRNLTSAKTYTQGYFNNYTNHLILLLIMIILILLADILMLQMKIVIYIQLQKFKLN